MSAQQAKSSDSKSKSKFQSLNINTVFQVDSFTIIPLNHDYLCRSLDRELLTKLHLRTYRLSMASKVSAKFPQLEELL